MADSRKRIALKPHMDRIREWVDEGKTDEWIADALGTSASSVQSFRSRNDIYRRDRTTQDRKSTRLNSSHANISYAVFCLKKKKTTITNHIYNIKLSAYINT